MVFMKVERKILLSEGKKYIEMNDTIKFSIKTGSS